MQPIQQYTGLFFGILAAIFLLSAFSRSGSDSGIFGPASKAFFRTGLIFAAVSIFLLLFSRFLH
jgi:hypothetical protein